jgi:alkyl hydroperoxide reductase subunit AhpF
LRDAIFYCPHCSLENFYDEKTLKHLGGNPGLCWACAAQLRLPPRIRIGKSVVMLNFDSKLFPHHIDDQRLYDFGEPVAEINVHPQNPQIWGLKRMWNLVAMSLWVSEQKFSLEK